MGGRLFTAALSALTALTLIAPTAALVDPAEAAAAAKPPHGTLVLPAQSLDGVVPLADASAIAKVTYRSTDRRNRPTVVTGVVALPRGTAPAGGWPVMAVAHTTTGILTPCAPSNYANLFGQTDMVNFFLHGGYAVALTDYQGLGSDGGHPYLDNQTAGRNVIDSVLAMRAVWPQVSTRWAAVGLSQGGGPAWAADELAASYARGLELKGAAAVSPPSDMTGIVAKSLAGTMTFDQGPALQWILASQARVDPRFPVDRFRAPEVLPLWDRLTKCEPQDLDDRFVAVLQLDRSWLKPKDPGATRLLTKRLQAMAVARRPLSAPLLVAYGGQDTLVDAAWTTAAIERQRALGGDVLVDFQPDRQHDRVDLSRVVIFLSTVLPPVSGLSLDLRAPGTRLRR